MPKYKCPLCGSKSDTYFCYDCRQKMTPEKRERQCLSCGDWNGSAEECDDCNYGKCIICGESVSQINYLYCKDCYYSYNEESEEDEERNFYDELLLNNESRRG
jgi:hypothetical protein